MIGISSLPPSVWPLLELAATLLAFEASLRLQRRLGGAALSNPVLITVALMSALLCVTGRSPVEYARATQVLPFLLGPATVALAVPLHRNLPRIRLAFGPVLVGVIFGAVTASVSAVAMVAILGGSKPLLMSIATKSATAAIDMAVAAEIGGDPDLAAGLSVLTGIIGAVICTWVLDVAKVRDVRARGLATGVAAHGIGTARMLVLDPEAGAFSSLGMGLAGVAAGVLVPVVARWIAH